MGKNAGAIGHVEMVEIGLRSRLAGLASGLLATIARVRRRRGRCLHALADDFKCILLDCDGVLWRGGEVISGSAESVLQLQRSGKQVLFVTNASSRTRADIAERISGMLGVTIPASSVVTSSSVAAATAAASHCKDAFLVGAEGLREEFRAAGVGLVDVKAPEPFDEVAFRALTKTLPPVSAVVIGHDEDFTYGKLALAAFFLQVGDACQFIGTNPDVGNRDVAGYLLPEAGSLIAAVEAVSSRKATVVGKPSAEVIRQVLREHSLNAHEVLMVGDRLDTDIRFGKAGKVKTCLVLTGVSTRDQCESVPLEFRPDHIRDCLQDIVQ